MGEQCPAPSRSMWGGGALVWVGQGPPARAPNPPPRWARKPCGCTPALPDLSPCPHPPEDLIGTWPPGPRMPDLRRHSRGSWAAEAFSRRRITVPRVSPRAPPTGAQSSSQGSLGQPGACREPVTWVWELAGVRMLQARVSEAGLSPRGPTWPLLPNSAEVCSAPCPRGLRGPRPVHVADRRRCSVSAPGRAGRRALRDTADLGSRARARSVPSSPRKGGCCLPRAGASARTALAVSVC